MKTVHFTTYRVGHMFLPSLRLIWGLTRQSYSRFQVLSQFSCFRASKEVCNIFLGQLAQKWQVFKVGSAKKECFTVIYVSNTMNVFWMYFSHLELCQTAIFVPVDLRTGYTHLLKALKEEKLTQYSNMEVEGENIWWTL